MDKSILEKSVESYLTRRAEKLGGLSIKLDSKSGLPDRLILLPDKRIAFVETKRPVGGILSSAQLVWLEKLRRLGFPAYTARTKEDIDRILAERVDGDTETE